MKTAECGCLYEGAIQMCPIHAQAPAIREALEHMLAYMDDLRASGLRLSLLKKSGSEERARAILKGITP